MFSIDFVILTFYNLKLEVWKTDALLMGVIIYFISNNHKEHATNAGKMRKGITHLRTNT